MSKEVSKQALQSDQFNLLFNESIVPQGIIIVVDSEKGSDSFLVSLTNKAFNEVANINSLKQPEPAESVFKFLDGFNCQPLKQFYKTTHATEAKFIYPATSETYNLSLKKLSDGSILFVLQNITDFQDSRSELNEKKRQLKESQEIAHLGYWVENHETKKHFWSDQIYAILNESSETIEPSFNNYLNFVFFEDRKRVDETFHTALKNKSGYEITHRLILKNGAIKHINQRCYTNYDYNDKPIQSVGIIQDITASELVKEELKSSEAIFRSVFDFAPIAIVLVNDQQQPVFCNTQFSEIVGYSIEEIYKKGLKDFTHPDDYENNLIQYKRLFSGEINSFSITKRYMRANGSQLWGKVTVSAIKSTNGLNNMAIAMVQDISAEKSATEEMIKSEYRYRTLIENASDGIGLFDFNFKPIIYNTVLYEVLGYTLEEYLNFDHNKFELFHPDDIPAAKEAIAKLKNNSSVRIENRMRHKDGSFSYFSINYIPVSHEGKPAILIFRRDINQRKKAELQNEEYRLFLETLMDNLPVSLFAKTTPDFRYLYWNATMEKMSGIAADDALGKNDFELMQFRPLAEQYFSEDEKLLKFRKRLESEHEYTNALGEVKQFRTIKTLHKSTIGSPLILGISMDITKLKEAELQVEQSNQMLKEAQKIAKLGYWEYDVKKDLFFDNLENRQILGIDKLPYFINSQQFKELLHPSDQEIVEQKFKKCIQTKTPGEGIVRIINQSDYKHVSIKYRAVEDDQGKVEKLRGTCLDITRIRRSEMELRESEKRLKQAEHIAKVGYYDYDFKTNETKFSDEIWKILEVKSPEITISLAQFFEAVHADDKVNVSSQFQKAKNSNQPFNLEFKITTRNNNIKYIKAIGTFVRNQDGSIGRSIGTFQDVTDLKEKEKSLQRKANQLLDIQHLAKIGFIEYNTESKQVNISDTLVKVLELNKDTSTFTMDDFDRFIHDEDRETIIRTIRQSIAQNQSYNLQYRLKLNNGKIKFVNEICCLTPNEPINGITRIIQDITPLKEQEITINKIVNIQESSLVGTWEYNLETKKYTLSEGLKKFFQFTEDQFDLYDFDLIDYIHVDDRYSVEQVIKKSTKIKESFAFSYRFVFNNNEIRFVNSYCNFYTNSMGECIMFGMVKDITEYRNILNDYNDKAEIFKLLTENSLLGIVIYKEDKRIFANQKWADLVGIDLETLNSGVQLSQIYKKETIDLILDLFNNWQEYNLTEYTNKVNFQPINAPEFSAEIYVKEIQYKNEKAFLIISLQSNKN